MMPGKTAKFIEDRKVSNSLNSVKKKGRRKDRKPRTESRTLCASF
jgi:hypothetical protein